MKKFLAVVLAAVMASAMLVFPVSAAKTPAVWNGKVSTSWYTGKKDTYNISTAAQLAGLSKLVNSGYSMKGVTINLTADIVLNDTSDWKNWYNDPPKNKFTPIGRSGNPIGGYYPFAGFFNGNGHSISGLYVKSYETAGLFGYLCGAAVSQVIIEKSCIIGYDDGKTELVNVGAYAGAIAGIAEGSIINRCENDGLVYCIGPDEIFSGERTAWAGGIVGSMHMENASEAVLAGALAAGGVFYNPAIFTDGSGDRIKSSGIVDCINYGEVTAKCAVYAYSGGIVGWGNNGYIKNCLSLSVMSAHGGSKKKIFYGGIAGGVYCCPLENCYQYDGLEVKGIGQNNASSALNVKVVDNVKNKTYDEIVSKKFAKQLGSSFVYVKGDRPYLACDKRLSSKSSSSAKPAVTVKNGKATIKWDAVSGAESYVIYSQKSDGKYSKLKTVSKNSVTISVKEGKKYKLIIKAKYSDGSLKTIKNGTVSFTA